MESNAFVPPVLAFDVRYIFEEEWLRSFPAIRDPRLIERAWKRFHRQASPPDPNNEVVCVLGAAQMRTAIAAWCMKELAAQTLRLAEKQRAESSRLMNQLADGVREQFPGECLLFDLPNGCVRGHDCERDGAHNKPAEADGAGGLAELMSNLLGLNVAGVEVVPVSARASSDQKSDPKKAN